MGFRWRKSFKIAPGIRINLSHRSVRAQIGSSPLSFSAPLLGGSKAKRITASLPPTGLSFVHTIKPAATTKNKRRKRGQYEPEEPALMADLFLSAVYGRAQLAMPPLQMDDLPSQPPKDLRSLFKSAVYDMAVLAGHDPDKEPFIITDALLFLDGHSEDGLVELAVDCRSRWREPAPEPDDQGRGASATSGFMSRPDQPDLSQDAARMIGCSTILVLIIGIIIGGWLSR